MQGAYFRHLLQYCQVMWKVRNTRRSADLLAEIQYMKSDLRHEQASRPRHKAKAPRKSSVASFKSESSSAYLRHDVLPVAKLAHELVHGIQACFWSTEQNSPKNWLTGIWLFMVVPLLAFLEDRML